MSDPEITKRLYDALDALITPVTGHKPVRVTPQPDRSPVTTTVYYVQRPLNPGQRSRHADIQVRVTTPGPCDELADKIATALTTTRNRTPAGLRVEYVHHKSTAPLGLDPAGRAERSDNYRLIIRP